MHSTFPYLRVALVNAVVGGSLEEILSHCRTLRECLCSHGKFLFFRLPVFQRDLSCQAICIPVVLVVYCFAKSGSVADSTAIDE